MASLYSAGRKTDATSSDQTIDLPGDQRFDIVQITVRSGSDPVRFAVDADSTDDTDETGNPTFIVQAGESYVAALDGLTLHYSLLSGSSATFDYALIGP